MKLFVVSDIHGYYSELLKALDEAGYKKDDPNNMLIVCGDFFDRGNKPYEIIEFLDSIPASNKALIRGNHEDLMEEMIERGYPMDHDYHNKTVNTFWMLTNHCEITEEDIAENDQGKLLKEQILDKFYSQMVDYYETENYVFVHGYIPITAKKEDWRNGDWYNARWYNGFDYAQMCGNPTGKTIVFGHWHCSHGNSILNHTPEYEEGADFSICYFVNNTIGIDACTAYTGKVNVLVLNDNLLSEGK